MPSPHFPPATQSPHADATTFIIGAGASHEFGLPVGSSLVRQIRDFLSPNLRDHSDLRDRQAVFAGLAQSRTATPDDLDTAAHKMHEGLHLFTSIDAFLHAHQDMAGVVPLGKALVTLMILRAERHSNLFPRERIPGHARAPDWDALSKTWASLFFPLLAEGCRPDDIQVRLQRCSFVVFNYDRCLEELLRTSFRKAAFAIDDAAAEALVRGTNIIHPYGQVGAVNRDGHNATPFGEDIAPQMLLHVSKSITTFAEGIASADLVQKIHNCVRAARRIVFLGFGFLPINMKMLAQDKDANILPQSCWATTFGISDEDSEHVRIQVGSTLPCLSSHVRVGTTSETCVKFFENLQKTLAFEWPRREKV